MEDAVHPDEFRQRFGQAAAVHHPQVAAALEVLELNGRPGVLLEWLIGLPSNDWPALAAVPGVWFRLLNQAALGLQAAHEAGLVHSHLEPASFVLNAEGILKLCGLGEPRWLRMPSHKPEAAAKSFPSASGLSASEGFAAASAMSPAPAAGQEETISGDLADLGRIAAGWAVPALRHKRSKGLLPTSLQTILERLASASPDQRYPSAAMLLEDLERARADVPAHAPAWERLLQQVRSLSAEDALLRQSA
jgi:serine/threonine protein kinase